MLFDLRIGECPCPDYRVAETAPDPPSVKPYRRPLLVGETPLRRVAERASGRVRDRSEALDATRVRRERPDLSASLVKRAPDGPR